MSKEHNRAGGKPMTDHHKNTTGPISKKQLLAEMQSEQAAWLALLDEIGEENMTQPEVAGGWSIKDIVAHITGWRRRTVLRFRAAQHRSPAPPGYVGNDILDRPASCDLRLRHVLLANLVEQCQPRRLLALHFSEKLLFADGSCGVFGVIGHRFASCYVVLCS